MPRLWPGIFIRKSWHDMSINELLGHLIKAVLSLAMLKRHYFCIVCFAPICHEDITRSFYCTHDISKDEIPLGDRESKLMAVLSSAALHAAHLLNFVSWILKPQRLNHSIKEFFLEWRHQNDLLCSSLLSEYIILLCIITDAASVFVDWSEGHQRSMKMVFHLIAVCFIFADDTRRYFICVSLPPANTYILAISWTVLFSCYSSRDAPAKMLSIAHTAAMPPWRYAQEMWELSI